MTNISSDGRVRLSGLLFLSLLASIVVGGQSALMVLQGGQLCVNHGCRIIEGLTTVPPLYINLLGLAYFQTIFWTSLVTRKRAKAASVLRLLLICGMAAEGSFLSYQTFVAHAFCWYCVCVFLMVVGLNILAGWRQLILGASLIAAQGLVFSLLTFTPLGNDSYELTLDQGTFAVRTCSNPVKRIYLIFSENCPHCESVIAALEGCSRCEFHFNPISRIDPSRFPELVKSSSYLPRINIHTLKILRIPTIPVLIVENQDGLTFIKGEQNIINYVKKTCFEDTGSLVPGLDDPFSVEDDDTCSVEDYCK
jgi:uncharacterized membrane protein